MSDAPLQPPVGPGVLRIYSDIACPWSHVLVHRLRVHQQELGLEGDLRIEHRAVPLELLNGRPTPLPLLRAEIDVLRHVEPDAGWSDFEGEPWTFPVSSFPALAAVQAAQDPAIGSPEALDAALRRAWFAEWRCLSLYPVVFEVASQVDGLDVEALEAAVRTGRPGAEVWRHFDEFRQLGLAGSPTVVVGESEPVFNPGFRSHWDGEPAQGGTLVIDEDDPSVVRELVERAMESMRFD